MATMFQNIGIYFASFTCIILLQTLPDMFFDAHLIDVGSDEKGVQYPGQFPIPYEGS